jgi:hypothetical protein
MGAPNPAWAGADTRPRRPTAHAPGGRPPGRPPGATPSPNIPSPQAAYVQVPQHPCPRLAPPSGRTRLRDRRVPPLRAEPAVVRAGRLPGRQGLCARPPVRLAAARGRHVRRGHPGLGPYLRQLRQSHLGPAPCLALLPPLHGPRDPARRRVPDPRQGDPLLRPLPPRGRRRPTASAEDPLPRVRGRRGLYVRPLPHPLGRPHPAGVGPPAAHRRPSPQPPAGGTPISLRSRAGGGTSRHG